MNRKTARDPWDLRDMWRLNHHAKRPLQLIDDKGKEQQTFIEYLNEDTFNVYTQDENGFFEPLAMNVKAKINPLDNDDLLLKDDAQMENIDYYIDQNNRVTLLDYEGEPMSLQVKVTELVTEDGVSGDGAGSASVKKITSPMPGTVTKVFCEPGQQVAAGDTLISVESMKMEYLVKAKADGEVDQVRCKPTDVVGMKQTLVMMK